MKKLTTFLLILLGLGLEGHSQELDTTKYNPGNCFSDAELRTLYSWLQSVDIGEVGDSVIYALIEDLKGCEKENQLKDSLIVQMELKIEDGKKLILKEREEQGLQQENILFLEASLEEEKNSAWKKYGIGGLIGFVVGVITSVVALR